MRSHGGRRIAIRGAALDFQAFYSIRIIGTPDLRAVIQHARIKTPAAAGTALDHQIGIACQQPVQELISAQHKPMSHFALPVSRQSMGIAVGDGTVEIPLHILDLCVIQHGAHGIEQIIHHVLPGHIQYQLIAGQHGR